MAIVLDNTDRFPKRDSVLNVVLCDTPQPSSVTLEDFIDSFQSITPYIDYLGK